VASERVVIIGAGMGGLAAAIALASRGVGVTVFERAAATGGKMREVPVAGTRIDAGPTVLTMRWVFDELLQDAGTSIENVVTLIPSELLARHAWNRTDRLDLYVDMERSADEVGRFAGADEARRFRAYCAKAADVYKTLEKPFLRSSRPNFLSLTQRVGFSNLPALMRLQPFATLWDALGASFKDPRLQQLYGRYATYCGSSPFDTPATLMLVSHVEQAGVWFVEGGMYRLAEALTVVAASLGVDVRCEAEVSEILVERGRASGVRLADGERLQADAIVVNADASAVGAGLFGPSAAGAVAPVSPADRSLSAVAVTAVASPRGFPLVRHSVFFSRDYRAEFNAIFRERRLPDEPTVYICAQDRGDEATEPPPDRERLLILVNAPAVADTHAFSEAEIATCLKHMQTKLDQCGLELTLDPESTQVASPSTFERLFPATGGAIYGRASHGWKASFQRPDATTSLPGLYLAGGSVHPGPGVPMAALSGRLAARAVLSGFAST
jgi:1-hydroxycarotenoid 3,4-desaturase